MKSRFLTIFAVLTAILLISGCKTQNQPLNNTAATTPQQPVTYESGPFKGTLPCSDCDGISTVITLYFNEDTKSPVKYFMTETYLGKTSPLSSQGTFKVVEGSSIDPKAVIYQTDPDTPEMSRYFLKVGDDELKLVNSDGSPFKGKQNYSLKYPSGN